MKILLLLLILFCTSGIGFCSPSPLSKHPITSDYKFSENDVTYSVDKTVNNVNLVKCRKELEKKQNELKELENSSVSPIIKSTKRIKLKQQISNLEENIRILEDGI